MSAEPHPVPATNASNSNHCEIEWQLAAPDLRAVHRWLTRHGSFENLILEPSSTLQLHDSYFDTEDWRIHRAGYALRLRTDSRKAEVTLKALHSSNTDVAIRREISEPVPDAAATDPILSLNGPVGERVHAVAGKQSLRALFEVRTERQRFTVRAKNGGETLGEVALDSTKFSRPQGNLQASMQRVEIESLNGTLPPLEKLVKTLREECTLEPVAESKYALGLQTVGLAPPSPPQFAPNVIDVSMRANELALANLRQHLSAWLAHVPGARLGDDIEALHDLRIAARRMNTVLSLYGPYLPRALVRAKPTLQKLLREFGSVRDLDVQLEELSRFARELMPSEREAVEPLARRLASERAQARRRMLRTLDSVTTQRWFERLTLTIVQSPAARTLSHQPLAVELAPELIRARHRKLRKSVNRLTPKSTMEDYHCVRGHAKKLRYAIESIAALYGKPADDLLRALRRLQNRLGAQHDAQMAATRLLALATDAAQATPSATVFMMGRLAERRAAAAAHFRERFEKAYRKVRGKRWRALRAKLEELRPKTGEAEKAAVKTETVATPESERS
jgi:CHAD domain-containing protein